MSPRVACVALLLTLAGCRVADFDLESEAREAPPLTRDVRVALVPAASVPPGLRDALEAALRAQPRVADVVDADGGSYDYEVRVELSRAIDGRGSNFLVAWPGFLVLAPLWNRYDWEYLVDTAVSVRRPGDPAGSFASARDEYDVSHATGLQMVEAELGFLTATITAFFGGLEAAVHEPNALEVDEDFAAVEAERWARRTVALIAEAIVQAEAQPAK